MILYITPLNWHEYMPEIDQLQQMRYRVFKERLNWKVRTEARREFDEYDHNGTVYVVYLDESRKVRGGVRLLPTLSNNMLKNTFNELVDKDLIPEDPYIWEASRFSVENADHKISKKSFVRQATIELLCGVIEFCFINGITRVATVTDTRVERIMALCGWNMRRLNDPIDSDGIKVVAGILEISEEQLINIMVRGNIFHDFSLNSSEARLTLLKNKNSLTCLSRIITGLSDGSPQRYKELRSELNALAG